MESIWIYILLFLLIGGLIGMFDVLLIFRMDEDYKRLLLGAANVFLIGGSGKMGVFAFSIPKERTVLLSLVFVVGLCLGLALAFNKMKALLKEQTGKHKIRLLDILLGYNSFLKDYYEQRKKDIDIDVKDETLAAKENDLKRQEKELDIQRKLIQEQKKGILKLELPENGEHILTESFIRKIPLFVNHMCKFTSDVDNLTTDFCMKFNGEGEGESEGYKNKNAKCLKGYFAGIGMYVANDLFGSSNDEVRTHFRILENGKYVQYAVILGSKIVDTKLSDVPQGKSLIERSFVLQKSLVASMNPESKYNTNTKWEDYITITYYSLKVNDSPFLSMGISIKYAEQFQDMLYFLSYCKIEEFLNTFIQRIDGKCDIVKTLH